MLASGWFSSAREAACAVTGLPAEAQVYMTVNPCARPVDRITGVVSPGVAACSDRDIQRRRWFLVDVDPVRPTGIGSTDAEKAEAWSVAMLVAERMADMAGALPCVCVDSGNGYHLYYRYSGTGAAPLAKRTLEWLKTLDTPSAKVDGTVFNLSRIMRLPGTVTRKGRDTAERPHRLSRVLMHDPAMGFLSEDRLTAALPVNRRESAYVPPADAVVWTPEDMEGWIARFMAPYRVGRVQEYLGGWKWPVETCPFDPSHTGGCACLFLMPSGARGYRCLHDSCMYNRWQELRRLVWDTWKSK